MADDNFNTRCLAALAGNGAALVSLANFAGDNLAEREILWGIGTLMVPSALGIWLAYLALGREKSVPHLAGRYLKWSVAALGVQIISLIVALQTQVINP